MRAPRATIWIACGLASIGCNQLSGMSGLDKVDGPGSGGPLAEPQYLSTGRHTSCVTSATDGLVRCWGATPGDGTTGSLRPVVVTGIRPLAVCHGYDHLCAQDDQGAVWCWGNNDHGQLGDGTHETRLVPTQVTDLSGVTKISCGAYHTCAKTEADHYCWGNNAFGQLGTGDTVDRNEPTLLALPPTTHFGAGAFYGCAVLESLELMCWGRNEHGQLGTDPVTTPVALSPELATGLPDFEKVYPGVGTTCARSPNVRELYCWGDNEHGQLGDGTTTASLTPVRVAEIARLGVLFPGVRHSCAYDTSNGDAISIYCWGANDHGQLGLPSDTAMYPTPQLVADGLLESALAGKTSEHTCYFDANRQVVCAGLNDTGQLGDGTTASRDSFAPVLF